MKPDFFVIYLMIFIDLNSLRLNQGKKNITNILIQRKKTFNLKSFQNDKIIKN